MFTFKILDTWKQQYLPKRVFFVVGFLIFVGGYCYIFLFLCSPFTDGGPRETLMHFAVRLGLLRLTWFLLQKPGGRGALSIHNKEGATPVSLALERGYHKLHQLLTE